MKNHGLIVIGIVVAFLAGCAQVPKESVELSETVGRDLHAIQKSHVHLVNLHYDKLEKDVNRFIDDVYVPYQIEKTLAEYKDTLLSAIKAGAEPDPSGSKQKAALGMLQIYVTELRANIEGYRKAHLAPLQEQRRKALRDLDEAYSRVATANSAVTGYLASVVKVTDVQNGLLAKLGFPDLQQQIGDAGVDLSAKLADLNKTASRGRDNLNKAITAFENLMASVNK